MLPPYSPQRILQGENYSTHYAIVIAYDEDNIPIEHNYNPIMNYMGNTNYFSNIIIIVYFQAKHHRAFFAIE